MVAIVTENDDAALALASKLRLSSGSDCLQTLYEAGQWLLEV